MLLRRILAHQGYMDEANDGTGGGGGGEGADTVVADMDAAVADIGDALGLGDPEGEDKGGEADKTKDGTASPPAKDKSAAPPLNETPEAKAAREARERATAASAAAKPKLGPDGKPVVEAPAAKAPPKSWKPERHEIFAKLPPEAQDYILQREAEVETGMQQRASAARYADNLYSILQPYEPLLKQQGVRSHGEAVQYLMNAHFALSTGDAAAKAKYFGSLAKSYGIDMVAAAAAAAAEGPTMTDAEKKLMERVNKLEGDRRQEQQQQLDSLKEASAAEVKKFAEDPAHPYFLEVAKEVTILLNDPSLTLADAYERAVWANPVTREKETQRLRKEAAEKAQKESEEAAAKAAKARGTRVKGDEKERASPDLLGSMDDTMREVYQNIQNRT